jgi:hypothetical protein
MTAGRCWLAPCLAAALAFSACSYHGAIRSEFIQRPAVPKTKIPLRVGLVQSSEFMEKTFVQNGADRDITIAVQPYLADAIYAELANIFAVAVLLKPADMDSRDVDLLMFQTYRYTTLKSNRFFKTFSMTQELAYSFRVPATAKEVVVLKSQDTLEYSQPSGARTAAIVCIASAFVLSPITIPIETQALGAHAVPLVEQSLSKMIQAQTEQVYMNRAVFTVRR